MTQELLYDDIVVGAGSCGAILAARLSEDANRSVLLLEAGPDYAAVETLPQDVANARTVSVVEHDWGYKAEAVPGRMMDYARGKVTGGCSAINGCIALRGIPADYDEWARWGNTDWAWDKVLPYFRKIENDEDAGEPAVGGDFHGKDGPVPVVRFRDNQLITLQKAFLDACLQRWQYVADHNDPASTGVGPIPMNRKGDLRISTVISHLNPARHRRNLTIRANSMVDRVIFEGDQAVGVALVKGGVAEELRGGRIHVAAGAVHTPPILMRSGIGPAAELARLGIKVVRDQPAVGANLIEHQQITVGIMPREGVCDPNDPDVQIIVRYTAPGTREFNNMQIYFVSRYVPESHRPISVMSVLQKPKCRGQVRLVSRDPDVQPQIVLNSYGEREDMRIALDGLRLCYQIATSPQISRYSLGVQVLTDEMMANDDALWQYIRERCATIWHPVGTAKMGPANDPSAVVDQHCRVHGVKNLRVVDASVMPNHVSANPNLTCYVIAERVAEWIKQGNV